jgi:hypothetical protein
MRQVMIEMVDRWTESLEGRTNDFSACPPRRRERYAR